MNRIEHKFQVLKRNNQKAFITFITAGYPNLSVTKELILAFAKSNVDIIELGVPFSDPMADGPIIQESSQVALERKVNLNNILNLVKDVRKITAIPICLMTYYNPIFCFGEVRFAKEAENAGVDGIIIPDLPPEEGAHFLKIANKLNLDTIFFLSPTSTLERIKLVSSVSRGFIYYVSLTGVTGPRQNLSSDLIRKIRTIKKYTSKPVCVGFGVSRPSQVRQICRIADGVIVGSAIIQKIKANIEKPDLVKRVADFVSSLNEGCK